MVELGGQPILVGLSSHQPFGGQRGCQMGREKCLASLETNCRITRAVYKTLCLECPDAKPSLYIGTTGRTTHSRPLEHQHSLRRQDGSSALSVHQSQKHPDKPPNFETSIIKGGMRFNAERFIREAIEIDDLKRNPEFGILNQRSEWGNSGLVQLNTNT